MSAASEMFGASAPTRSWAIGRSNVVAITAITIVAILEQIRWGTVPDTSWLITVCERMLAGERIYIDLHETNPPFSIWLYMPPVMLAKALGIAPEVLVHAWTYLAVFIGLGLSARIVRRARFEEADAMVAIAPVIYALLILFAGNAFTQREHIGVALFLPMLALMAWRLRSNCEPQSTIPLSLAAGICGSVLLLVKPHYALMVLLPVAFICWRHRSLRPLLAIEHWVIGAICLGYLAAVLLIHPEYVTDVYPTLADTYATVRVFRPIVELYGAAAVFLCLALWLYWPAGRLPALACIALLASVAGAITLVWQGKGWAYHAYPALLCAFLTLACMSRLPARHLRGKLGQPIRIVVLAFAVWASVAPLRLTQATPDELVLVIRAAAPRPTIASISTDISVGHPLSRKVGGYYRSTYPSLWTVRSAERLMEEAEGDAAEAARLKNLRDGFIAQAVGEIERIKPDLILDSGSNMAVPQLAIHADTGMKRLLRGYRTLYQDTQMTVFIRSDLPPGGEATSHGR
jgi:hypothetical protein